jgi:hypothetical protein
LNTDRNSRGTCEDGQGNALHGVKQIAVHGGTHTGTPKVIADFAKYVIKQRVNYLWQGNWKAKSRL